MAFDWGSALGAALMAWMGNKDSSGSTPNFYNIPLSPEQKWREDETKKLYEAGGSPQMQAIRNAGLNFLGSMPQAPKDFQFMSPFLKGQQFAGGMGTPSFSFSPPAGMPSGYTPTPPKADPPRVDITRPDGPGEKEIVGRGENPLMPDSGSGPLGPNPGALDFMGGNDNNESTSEIASRFSTWWQNNKSQLAGLGIDAVMGAFSAATGYPVGAAAKAVGVTGYLKKKLNQNDSDYLPKPTNTLGNVAATAPGTRDSAGNAPPRNAGNPFNGNSGSSTYNPSTDRWEYTPSFGEDRQSYWNADFFRGLQSGPGDTVSSTGQKSIMNQITRPGGRR